MLTWSGTEWFDESGRVPRLVFPFLDGSIVNLPGNPKKKNFCWKFPKKVAN